MSVSLSMSLQGGGLPQIRRRSKHRARRGMQESLPHTRYLYVVLWCIHELLLHVGSARHSLLSTYNCPCRADRAKRAVVAMQTPAEGVVSAGGGEGRAARQASISSCQRHSSCTACAAGNSGAAAVQFLLQTFATHSREAIGMFRGCYTPHQVSSTAQCAWPCKQATPTLPLSREAGRGRAAAGGDVSSTFGWLGCSGSTTIP